jgi:hypothetical protein
MEPSLVHQNKTFYNLKRMRPFTWPAQVSMPAQHS